MNKIKYFITTVGIAASVTPAAGMQKGEATLTPSFLKLERISLSHTDSTLLLSFEIRPEQVRPGRDRQVVFTPVIRSTGAETQDSVEMKPITLAGRNRYYTRMREGDLELGELTYRAGRKGLIEYNRAVEWQPWMENAELVIREETQNCCKPVKPLCDTPLAKIETSNEDCTPDLTDIDYVALTGDSTVELEARGSAFVDFVVNRTEIREDYRKNPRELRKIIESINMIKDDPAFTITRLTIKGFASPEGSYANNVRLAMGRTEALKEYVRKKYDFDPEIMHTDYEPEDWEGLRAWLETATMPNRDKILEIAASDMEPDAKDAKIKRLFPRQYKLMLDSIYPALRHSDYTIRYRIKTHVDIKELKRLYKDSPERLRPVDFYRVARTFPEGSREFEEVFLKAAEIYPHDPQAALNAANIFMKHGELEKAAERVSYAGESPEAEYTRAMIATVNKDYERANFFLQKAKEKGHEKADEKMEWIEQNTKKQNITYLINTQKTGTNK